jgi:hypothetical protein
VLPRGIVSVSSSSSPPQQKRKLIVIEDSDDEEKEEKEEKSPKRRRLSPDPYGSSYAPEEFRPLITSSSSRAVPHTTVLSPEGALEIMQELQSRPLASPCNYNSEIRTGFKSAGKAAVAIFNMPRDELLYLCLQTKVAPGSNNAETCNRLIQFYLVQATNDALEALADFENKNKNNNTNNNKKQ